MVRIFRDAYGIPHVRGATALDVAHGQGLASARDRVWQLEWLARRALGTTAELFGDTARPWDDFATRARIQSTAKRAWDAAAAETCAFVGAYVEGVNAGLVEALAAGELPPELIELGAEPQPWEPWLPMAIHQAQHLLFAGLGGLLWQRRAYAALGPDAAVLSREGPITSGSNAWAVGGGRTASGRPLIGGDPHRNIEQPGIYHQVRLHCEDEGWDVAGIAFVGVPGIPHFAHAGEVAWAITNGCADYQDVLDEPTDDTVPLRGGLHLCDAPTVLGDLGFDALLPLLRARSVEDVDAAMDHWVVPVNNAVIADRGGVVRYRIAGRVPKRDQTGRWVSWLGNSDADVNRIDAPPEGEVITANERRGPESAAIGSVFAPPERAERIRELLAGRSGLVTADFVAIHNDVHLATAPVLTALVPGAFDDWDHEMSADSPGAARFAGWRSALVRRIAAEPVLADLFVASDEPVLEPALDPVARIALALTTLVEAGKPFGIDLPALALEALAEIDQAESEQSVAQAWGDTHVASPMHAFTTHGRQPPGPPLPTVPVSGDSDTVRVTASYPAQTDACFRGSVARHVWDLDDRSRGGWVVPTGAHGVSTHPHHHDQLAAWAAGDLVPIVADWDQLTEEPGVREKS